MNAAYKSGDIWDEAIIPFTKPVYRRTITHETHLVEKLCQKY